MYPRAPSLPMQNAAKSPAAHAMAANAPTWEISSLIPSMSISNGAAPFSLGEYILLRVAWLE
jgi:hypothetical protein